MIYKSASKIVFLLMALATVAALFTNKIDAKDYIILATMAFQFYFSNKGDVSNEFLGK